MDHLPQEFWKRRPLLRAKNVLCRTQRVVTGAALVKYSINIALTNAIYFLEEFIKIKNTIYT